MRTRSSTRNRPQQQVTPNIEPFDLEEPIENQAPPVVTMADQRTMAQLLQAPTEGYEDAIVVPAITADNFELKHGLLTLVQNKPFFGHDKEDPHAHIRYFNKITSTLKFPNVPNTSIKLMLFPFSLEGAARIWLEKEPPRSILTWDDLVSKFINQFFPPSKTTQNNQPSKRRSPVSDNVLMISFSLACDLIQGSPTCMPTTRVKVPAGRYVVPTGKDNVTVSAGRSKVIPAGRKILVLRGLSRKKTGRDPKGNIMILPPVSVEEHIVVQRETKARTILLQSLPEDHMADFHHLDDARDNLVFAVKARLMTVFQKVLSQLNQMQAKPDNEDCNMKFLRALPPSWSQVAITLKTKGGLDYLSFDDMYNKLRTLEIKCEGLAQVYGIQELLPPASSSGLILSAIVIKSVLHSFVAEVIHNSRSLMRILIHIGKLDLEELDIKLAMAMLSVRINRFEKKAGRKMKFNNRRLLARYSAFKLKELDKSEEPKALLSVDSMLNWSDHEGEDEEKGASTIICGYCWRR
ncbi:reverse transcriptase domain-containing protein [Tanacetum coccineum]